MIPKIAPSILAADFAELGDAIRSIEEARADWVHIDVMDGHFVPNISIGIPVVKSIRPITRMLLDVHLMISEPDKYIQPFAKAGADQLTPHIEVLVNPSETLKAIREAGCKVGLAINPETSPDAIAPYMAEIDVVVVMSVNPGFGGQSFIDGSLEKITAIRALCNQYNPACEITVDGGVGPQNARDCVEAGASVLVAGSAIFRSPHGVKRAIQMLKEQKHD